MVLLEDGPAIRTFQAQSVTIWQTLRTGRLLVSAASQPGLH